MGFGSYDESEQENRNMDTDLEDEEQESVREKEHEGEVLFEMEETQSAIERLKKIQEE
jgi:hypothetical protein